MRNRGFICLQVLSDMLDTFFYFGHNKSTTLVHFVHNILIIWLVIQWISDQKKPMVNSFVFHLLTDVLDFHFCCLGLLIGWFCWFAPVFFNDFFPLSVIVLRCIYLPPKPISKARQTGPGSIIWKLIRIRYSADTRKMWKRETSSVESLRLNDLGSQIKTL